MDCNRLRDAIMSAIIRAVGRQRANGLKIEGVIHWQLIADEVMQALDRRLDGAARSLGVDFNQEPALPKQFKYHGSEEVRERIERMAPKKTKPLLGDYALWEFIQAVQGPVFSVNAHGAELEKADYRALQGVVKSTPVSWNSDLDANARVNCLQENEPHKDDIWAKHLQKQEAEKAAQKKAELEAYGVAQRAMAEEAERQLKRMQEQAEIARRMAVVVDDRNDPKRSQRAKLLDQPTGNEPFRPGRKTATHAHTLTWGDVITIEPTYDADQTLLRVTVPYGGLVPSDGDRIKLDMAEMWPNWQVRSVALSSAPEGRLITLVPLP